MENLLQAVFEFPVYTVLIFSFPYQGQYGMIGIVWQNSDFITD